jgi:hypothetical protein
VTLGQERSAQGVYLYAPKAIERADDYRVFRELDLLLVDVLAFLFDTFLLPFPELFTAINTLHVV